MTEKKERTTEMDVDALLTEVTGSIQTGRLPKAKPAAEPSPAKAKPVAPAVAEDKTEVLATAPAPEVKSIRIRQIKSGICAPVDQKQALLGLGLRRIRQEVVRKDSPSLRGQILKVRHLVEVVGE